MPPRFVNPHSLPESSVKVSRREAFVNGEADENGDDIDKDPRLLNELQELISTIWDLAPSSPEKPSRKRRKLKHSEPDNNEPIDFRLLSGSRGTHPIFLCPKSAALPITSEPDAEDNEAQANLRAQRAKAVAIDGSSLLLKDYRPIQHCRKQELIYMNAKSPMSSSPVMMILECNQPPRSTRPPVHHSNLQHPPYHDGPALPHNSSASTPLCPVVEVIPVSQVPLSKSMSRRRKRPQRERPPPAFWRPNPAIGGKSLGYAMGFPCSVEVLQSGTNTFTWYPRNKIRSHSADA